MGISKKKYARGDTKDLILRVQKDDDSEALDALMRIHDGLVWYVVNGCGYHTTTAVGLDDMVQMGRIGLINAIRNYDPEKGELSTYATWRIFSEIQRGIQNIGTAVRIPVHIQDEMARINKVAEKYPDKSSVELAECIAKDLEISVDRVTFVLTMAHSFCHMSSLDVPIGAEGDNFLIEFIPDGRREAEDDIIEKEIREWINNSLQTVSEKERFAIVSYLGFNDSPDRTLEAIGKELGVTRERVRQIIARGIRRMRGPEFRDGEEFLSYYSEGRAG